MQQCWTHRQTFPEGFIIKKSLKVFLERDLSASLRSRRVVYVMFYGVVPLAPKEGGGHQSFSACCILRIVWRMGQNQWIRRMGMGSMD